MHLLFYVILNRGCDYNHREILTCIIKPHLQSNLIFSLKADDEEKLSRLRASVLQIPGTPC